MTCQGSIIYPELKQEDFTWCIYQLSNDGYDVHGCLNASGIISISDAGSKVNLLDKVWIDTKTYSPANQGILSISNYNGLFDQALFTCSVNNKNMSAIQFLEIDLYGEPSEGLLVAPTIPYMQGLVVYKSEMVKSEVLLKAC